MGFLLVATLGVAPASGQSVLVAPHLVTLSHAERGGNVTVYNPGDAAVELDVELVYGLPVVDSTGEFVLEMRPTGPRDASPWLAAYPRRLRLDPLQRQTLRLMATPPADLADGEYWARLAVTARRDAVADSVATDRVQVGLGLEIRTVLPVLYRKGTPTATVAIGEPSLRREGDSLAVRLPLEPTGSAAYLGTATVSLLGGAGEVLSVVDLPLSLYVASVPRLVFATGWTGARALRVEVETEREDLASLPMLKSAPVVRVFPLAP